MIQEDIDKQKGEVTMQCRPKYKTKVEIVFIKCQTGFGTPDAEQADTQRAAVVSLTSPMRQTEENVSIYRRWQGANGTVASP